MKKNVEMTRMFMKRLRLLLWLAVLGMITGFNGCIPCYYAPSAQNVPMLNEKKDIRLSGGLKIGSYTNGCDFQGAVAAGKHFGLIANYSRFFGDSDEKSMLLSKGGMTEFGLGYFNSVQGNLLRVFEIYWGGGISKVKTVSDGWMYNASTISTFSLFIQPSIGVSKKAFAFAFSTRLRMLDFYKVAYDYNPNISDYALERMEDRPMDYFLEPAFTLRFGGNVAKFQMQFGYSIILSQSMGVYYDPFHMNFGLIVSLPAKK